MLIKIVGLIIFAILCAVGVVHAPKGNTMIGETADKFINYLGVFAIPFILWFWEDKRTKEERVERLKKEEEYLNGLTQKYKIAAVKGIEKLLKSHCVANWADVWFDYFQTGSRESIFTDKEHEYFCGILTHLDLFCYKYCLQTKIMPKSNDFESYKGWLQEECKKFKTSTYDQQIREYLKNNLPPT